MYQSIPKLDMKGWGPSLIHARGYNTTLFAGQSKGSYVLIFVPKKLEDFETFNAVLKRGAWEPTARNKDQLETFEKVKRKSWDRNSSYSKYIYKGYLGRGAVHVCAWTL